jgi:hypothetical protein
MSTKSSANGAKKHPKCSRAKGGRRPSFCSPIHWKRDRGRENFYGHNNTGDLICYVYENVDMRLRRWEPSWQAHFYIGGEERPMQGKCRLGYFRTRGLAKRAALRRYRALLAHWANDMDEGLRSSVSDHKTDEL